VSLVVIFCAYFIFLQHSWKTGVTMTSPKIFLFRYTTTTINTNPFTLILNAVWLIFLYHKFLLQLFFNGDDFCLFPDLFWMFQNGTTFYWYADWVRTVLHQVCFFTEVRCMGLTKIRAITA